MKSSLFGFLMIAALFVSPAFSSEGNVPTYQFAGAFIVNDSSLGAGIDLHFTSDFLPEGEFINRDFELLCKLFTPLIAPKLIEANQIQNPNFVSVTHKSGGMVGVARNLNFEIDGSSCKGPLRK